MQDYEAAWICEKLKMTNTVLDLGYGSGIIARALVEKNKQVTVVDGAPFNVVGAKCVVSMFEDYHPPQRFGAVIASFVLEHVENPNLLLRRMRDWASKAIVVVGNANSIHRQLAVRMGIQPRLDTLSARDEAVGHYRVYDLAGIEGDLAAAGWTVKERKGFMFKPLPNSMMAGFSLPLLKAMNEIDLPVELMANVGLVCE